MKYYAVVGRSLCVKLLHFFFRVFICRRPLSLYHFSAFLHCLCGGASGEMRINTATIKINWNIMRKFWFIGQPIKYCLCFINAKTRATRRSIRHARAQCRRCSIGIKRCFRRCITIQYSSRPIMSECLSVAAPNCIIILYKYRYSPFGWCKTINTFAINGKWRCFWCRSEEHFSFFFCKTKM